MTYALRESYLSHKGTGREPDKGPSNQIAVEYNGPVLLCEQSELLLQLGPKSFCECQLNEMQLYSAKQTTYLNAKEGTYYLTQAGSAQGAKSFGPISDPRTVQGLGQSKTTRTPTLAECILLGIDWVGSLCGVCIPFLSSQSVSGL